MKEQDSLRLKVGGGEIWFVIGRPLKELALPGGRLILAPTKCGRSFCAVGRGLAPAAPRLSNSILPLSFSFVIDHRGQICYTLFSKGGINHANNFHVSGNQNHHVLGRPYAPHFHASYGGEEALISITDLEVLEGTLPGKQLKMVLGWAALRQDQLMDNWDLATKRQELFVIEPLR